jgi:hypothetical protein
VTGFALGAVILMLVGTTALLSAAALRVEDLPRVFLASYVIGFGEIVALVLFLSAFDAVTRDNLIAGSAALLVAVTGIWLLVGHPRLTLGVRISRLRQLATPLIVLAAFVGLGLAYVVALTVGTAPNGWDPLNYHLARAAFWLQSQHVGYIEPTYDARLNLNPPDGEIGSAFVLGVTHQETLVGFVQFFAALACAGGVYAIARRIGLTRAEAAFGSLLFLSLPIVLLQASLAKNDLVVASFLLAAATFILGSRRRDVVLVGLATALAVGTKSTAAYGVVLLLGLALTPRGTPELGRVARATAIVAGAFIGSYWYVVNVAQTGSLLGDQSALENVTATLRGAENVITAFGMAVDTFDISGARGRDILLYAAGGLALAGWMFLRRERRQAALVTAGVLAVPFVLLLVSDHAARPGFEQLYDLLGQPTAYLGTGAIASPTVASDTASWFGPVGFLCVVGSVVGATREARRRSLTPVVAILTVAPLAALVLVALSLSYHPWLGRFFIFPVALSAAVWGRALRSSAVWGLTALAGLTVVLVLVNYAEKPSGIRLLDRTHTTSVWTMRRWEVQSQHDPPLAPLLQFVDEQMPRTAKVALDLGDNDFGYPMFGPHLDRHVTVVPPGSTAPNSDAGWLVANSERATELDAACWQRVFESSEGTVFRRKRCV